MDGFQRLWRELIRPPGKLISPPPPPPPLSPRPGSVPTCQSLPGCWGNWVQSVCVSCTRIGVCVPKHDTDFAAMLFCHFFVNLSLFIGG